MAAVHFGEQLPAGFFRRRRDVARGEQIVDRRAPAAERHALMKGGQEAVAPIDRAAGRHAPHVRQHDERRQVIGIATESIGKPRAEHGKAVQPKAGVGLERGRRVVRRLGDHRADERQFVSHARQMRKQIGNPEAALAALFEIEKRLVEQADLAEKHVGLLFAFELLAMMLVEARLVVE